MQWQVLADVHGAHEKLARLANLSQPIMLLGDNLNLVDFHSLSGIAARVLTKGDVARVLLALSTGGPKKALKLADRLFFKNPERIAHAKVEILKDYNELAALLPQTDCWVLNGNVDWPELLEQALGPRFIRASRIEIDGVRLGLLSGTGSYPYSMRLPGEMSDADYSAALNELGEVDVLCTHFPPAVEGLTWDVVAKRDEGGGAMLTEYLGDVKPALHLFGHIHNPREQVTQFQNTRLVNVGGFRYHGRVWRLDLETLDIRLESGKKA
jgi:Icc-related predicted phosphoesterase